MTVQKTINSRWINRFPDLLFIRLVYFFRSCEFTSFGSLQKWTQELLLLFNCHILMITPTAAFYFNCLNSLPIIARNHLTLQGSLRHLHIPQSLPLFLAVLMLYILFAIFVVVLDLSLLSFSLLRGCCVK